MNFITYINTPTYINTRPVDNVNLETFTAKAPVAKYYRKTSSCCPNQTTQVFTNKKCCVKPIYSANTVVSRDYYTTNAQYLQARCRLYDQNNSKLDFDPNNNSAKPNCINATCNSTTYKRSNPTFTTQGAVSSSARLLQKKYNSIQTNASFNPRQSNYTGDNTQNIPLLSQPCVSHRRNGDKTRCD